LELTGFSTEELLKEPLEHEEKELRPYRMTHVLISFPPEKMIEVQRHLEAILEIDGVEYEQGSN
jgi:hypothetical protein